MLLALLPVGMRSTLFESFLPEQLKGKHIVINIHLFSFRPIRFVVILLDAIL